MRLSEGEDRVCLKHDLYWKCDPTRGARVDWISLFTFTFRTAASENLLCDIVVPAFSNISIFFAKGRVFLRGRGPCAPLLGTG